NSLLALKRPDVRPLPLEVLIDPADHYARVDARTVRPQVQVADARILRQWEVAQARLIRVVERGILARVGTGDEARVGVNPVLLLASRLAEQGNRAVDFLLPLEAPRRAVWHVEITIAIEDVPLLARPHRPLVDHHDVVLEHLVGTGDGYWKADAGAA